MAWKIELPWRSRHRKAADGFARIESDKMIDACNHLLCETDDAARNRRRFRNERSGVELDTACRTNDDPSRRRRSRFVEILRIFPRDRSFPIQHVDDALRKARLEKGQQL